MKRERLKPKVTREKLVKKPSSDAFDEMEQEYENLALERAHRKLASLEHEILVIQNAAHELIRKAENEAARKARAEVTRKYEFRLKELEVENAKLARQVSRFGDTIACPDCGACHPLVDYLKAE